MSLFSYHLVELSFASALKSLFVPLKVTQVNGLIHSETMSVMKLGSSIFSITRIFSKKVVFFAQWENESALTLFLNENNFGKKLAKGWYVKLQFLRQWGKFDGFKTKEFNTEAINHVNTPVVAVTIARMKYTEIPRFLKWGKPVEKLVRDHKGTTLSLASIRYPNTVSTFSIWINQQEMTNMVYGHNEIPEPRRHINAMKENERKKFHFEFATYRFKTISEHGSWNNQRHFIPYKR